MSSKLNVVEIIKGHFATLKSADRKKLSKIDLFIFVALPVSAAVAFAVLGYDINLELRSLLVNFGAIFTALLLSVLVLVYDQEGKYANKPENDAINHSKKELLRELYYNISFSIICAIGLVIVSMLHVLLEKIPLDFTVLSCKFAGTVGSAILTPIVVYLTITIFLNVVMVVKRMHTLLTT
ncbi:MAG: hypothetical protein K2Q45_06990 [Nitrosomonas sp.]|nr:hypothetical protein [Nitrosomonas sp.]